MASIALCEEILSALRQRGSVTVESEKDFAAEADLKTSWKKREVKSALSHLITCGNIRRSRPMPEGCTDTKRPITFQYNKG